MVVASWTSGVLQIHACMVKSDAAWLMGSGEGLWLPWAPVRLLLWQLCNGKIPDKVSGYRDCDGVLELQFHFSFICGINREMLGRESVLYLPATQRCFAEYQAANMYEAQRVHADQVMCVEQTQFDSIIIVLGDFNRGNVSQDLHKYKQLIKCPTREANTLDHCTPQ